MHCTSCGSGLTESATFCTSCGVAITTAVPTKPKRDPLARRAGVTLAVLCFVSLGLCAFRGGDEPDKPRMSYRIRIDAAMDGDTVTLAGTTNIPDKGIIRCEVSYQGDFRQAGDYETLVALGTTRISDGEFALAGDISTLPPGPRRVYCTAMAHEQPNEIPALGIVETDQTIN